MINFIKTNKLLVAIIGLAVIVIGSYVFFASNGASPNALPPVLISTPKPSIESSPIPYTDLSEETKAQLQTEADNKFSQFFEQTFKQYPWFNELPLQADHYFVYFDLKNRTIFAIIYQNKFVRGVTVDTTKQEIIDQLTKLGVDLVALPIEWQIK